jgi:hypothetical protein
MSDGGRGCASFAAKVWKSSQKVERTTVRHSLHRPDPSPVLVDVKAANDAAKAAIAAARSGTENGHP